MKTIVWTDGSCNANGEQDVGGWAAVIERDGTTEQERLVGRAVDTTHNRMELTAVCEALEQLNGRLKYGRTAPTSKSVSATIGTTGGARRASGGRQEDDP